MGGRFSNFENVDRRSSSLSSISSSSIIPSSQLPHSSSSSRIITFHSSAKWKAHFDASKSTTKLMVIDFTATWCGPCKFMDPIIKEFAAKYADVEFIKIDVDELMDVAEEYKVEAMPAFIFIKKGKVADKMVGARKEELQKLIEKHRKINY